MIYTHVQTCEPYLFMVGLHRNFSSSLSIFVSVADVFHINCAVSMFGNTTAMSEPSSFSGVSSRESCWRLRSWQVFPFRVAGGLALNQSTADQTGKLSDNTQHNILSWYNWSELSQSSQSAADKVNVEILT